MLNRILLLVAVFVMTAIPVQAMSVSSVGHPIYLSRNGEAATSGDVKFVMQGNVVKMLSKDGTEEFLSFDNTDGITGNTVDYSIRDVYTSNPTMHLWEVMASAGPSGKNCGYWLVGKCEEHKYVAYVSYPSFIGVGYKAKEWHQLRSNLFNGQLLITSSHTYLPPGKQYDYEAMSADDFRVQLFWDEKKNWFGLRKIF